MHSAAQPDTPSTPTVQDSVQLSVVVPLLNESDNIAPLHEKLTQSLGALDRSYEIIFVDDGSTDDTAQRIAEMAQQDAHVIAISFRRNFGQTAAMSAGFDQARGEIVIPMDGDLQNDPADIQRLIETLEQGYDVVSGWRKDRQDPFIRVLPSRIANAMISWVSGVHLHDYGCSLKAYRREVLSGIRLYGEMHRFIPIYATWQGARVTEVPVTHHPRTRGQSKYGFDRTIKVMLDLIVVKFLSAYSTKPIYIFGGFGMLSLLLSVVAFLLALFFKLTPETWGDAWHKDFSQTPLPIFSMGLFVVGLQMILMGLLAEMLMRTYYESQDKRAYVVRSIVRHDAQQQEQAEA